MAQLATKANSLIIAAFILVFGMIGLLYVQYNADVRDAQLWVDHTYTVQSHIKDLRIAMDEAEAGQRGYLLTGRDTFLEPYNAARDRSALLYGELKNLTADSALEQGRLEKLSPLMQQKLALIAASIEAKKVAGAGAPPDLSELDRGRAVMTGIRNLLAAMTATEAGYLRQRLADVASVRTRTTILVSTGAAAAVLLLIVGALMLRRAARDRRRADQAVRDAASQLRLSFDSLSQGVAVFDADRRLINWNQCFTNLLDLPPEQIQRGAAYTTVAALLAEKGEFLETEAQLDAASPATGNTPVVFQRQREEGRTFELRRTMLPAGGFAVTVTDITMQVRAEEVQRNSQKMRALGELTGGVAHDFNNLLTVIAGNLDLLQSKKALDQDAQRYVAGALRGVDRGTSLTQHLLAFGRRQPLAPRPVDLNRLAAEMTSGMLRRALGERIDIKIVESAGLWPAYADPAQVENAILNLAINARDAMSEGGKLTIETANVTLDEHYAEQNEEVAAGQYVMIAVSDTGSGMSSEVVARAFEPFYTTKEEGKGSGLGLAMVHGFAKQSKGHVKIYSETGNGTNVKLYLPRSQRAVAEEPQSPAMLPRGTASVLVVEDDVDVRRIAVAQLTDLGYRVHDAADAESGLRIFTETGNIDLLLTDVVLPGRLRGRDLADLISRASPTTKILFMSGYTENAIVHDGKLDEGTLLLSKPFRREDLAKKVALALNLGDQPQADNVVRLSPH
ncbi:MAG TPA: CHASE3 domain-containing protein [Stellaceae bacterium]|nr:CHASE3 domain-containing protein [Stellaceae bacterium]